MEERERCRAEIRASLDRGDPLETTIVLNSAAWEADHWWRSVYDVLRDRQAVK